MTKRGFPVPPDTHAIMLEALSSDRAFPHWLYRRHGGGGAPEKTQLLIKDQLTFVKQVFDRLMKRAQFEDIDVSVVQLQYFKVRGVVCVGVKSVGCIDR